MRTVDLFEVVFVGLTSEGVVYEKYRPGKLYKSIASARQAARCTVSRLNTDSVKYIFYLERVYHGPEAFI